MDSEAVLPSSPPHATITNVPDSPFFEPSYNTPSPKSSSPPPLFSSDDSCESADLTNYESPRIFKNKRKGAWWNNAESAHQTPKAKKIKMTRNYDSGVYMMSDFTDSSESLLPAHKPPFGFDSANDSPPKRLYSQEEERFLDRLYAGMDMNSQTYDFSCLNLRDSDIGRIRELASVIKTVPDPGHYLPSEGQYRSLVPALNIDLSDNKLQHLTPALFRLQNLRTLTLTNNDIKELPAQIGELHQLEELHITRNHIRWLPFDMLELFCGSSAGSPCVFGDSGIDWLMPKSQLEFKAWPLHTRLEKITATVEVPSLPQLRLACTSESDPDQPLWHFQGAAWHRDPTFTPSFCLIQARLNQGRYYPHHPAKANTDDYRHLPSYFARTLVSYFEETGNLVKGSPKPPSNDNVFTVLTETVRGVHGVPDAWFTPPHTKTTKSLLTFSIYSALRHMGQEDLTIQDLRHHIGDPVPPVAEAILEQAERNSLGGFGVFKICHTCKCEYVIARAEWIEWWCQGYCSVWPFKVQVCSWGCVPDAVLKRPVNVMSWE